MSKEATNYFIEIEKPKEYIVLPDLVDCYVLVNVDRKSCGPLSCELNALLPLRRPNPTGKASNVRDCDVIFQNEVREFPALDHLKRIRRRPATDDEIDLRGGNHQNEPITTETIPREIPITENKGMNHNDFNHHETSTDRVLRSQLEPKRKRKKQNLKEHCTPWSLDILVGSVEAVECLLRNSSKSNKNQYESSTTLFTLKSVLEKYNLSHKSTQFKRLSLPGRPAHTKEELNIWNANLWPTLFFEKQTAQFKEEQLALTRSEIQQMIKGMNEAVQDAYLGRQLWKDRYSLSCSENTCTDYSYLLAISGAVVMNPENDLIVSRASQERELQEECDVNMNKMEGSNVMPQGLVNPLRTSAILAIQGVSRLERQSALGHGMESEVFQTGQYLCTGYDVYITKEPNIYEAMALVHSRVRRVIFGVPDRELGGLGGAADSVKGVKVGVHSLPGTNHHYRAFRVGVNDSSDQIFEVLKEAITKLHPE